MAFNIGYVGLCERNIKHIYTTTDIKQPATRKTLPYKPEFLREQDRIRKDQIRNRRFMEYYPIHNIELPKAASFRTLSKTKVDECVTRLMLPAKERFNFKFIHNQQQNDWRQAYNDKIKRMRETMAKFGGHQSQGEKTEPKTDVKIRTGELCEKKQRTRRKGKMKIEEAKEKEKGIQNSFPKNETGNFENLHVLS